MSETPSKELQQPPAPAPAPPQPQQQQDPASSLPQENNDEKKKVNNHSEEGKASSSTTMGGNFFVGGKKIQMLVPSPTTTKVTIKSSSIIRTATQMDETTTTTTTTDPYSMNTQNNKEKASLRLPESEGKTTDKMEEEKADESKTSAAASASRPAVDDSNDKMDIDDDTEKTTDDKLEKTMTSEATGVSLPTNDSTSDKKMETDNAQKKVAAVGLMESLPVSTTDASTGDKAVETSNGDTAVSNDGQPKEAPIPKESHDNAAVNLEEAKLPPRGGADDADDAASWNSADNVENMLLGDSNKDDEEARQVLNIQNPDSGTGGGAGANRNTLPSINVDNPPSPSGDSVSKLFMKLTDVSSPHQQQQQQQRNNDQSSHTLHPHDVLVGKDDVTVGNHHGNLKLRWWVDLRKETWKDSNLEKRNELADHVLKRLKEQDPPGRFMSNGNDDGLWMVLDEDMARKKVFETFDNALKNTKVMEPPGDTPPATPTRELFVAATATKTTPKHTVVDNHGAGPSPKTLKKEAARKTVTGKPYKPVPAGKRKTDTGKPDPPVYEGPPDELLAGGWPKGWVKRVFKRKTGTPGAKNTDKYWFSPGGYKMRSMVEVKKFMKALEVHKGDEELAHKAFKVGNASPKKRGQPQQPKKQTKTTAVTKKTPPAQQPPKKRTKTTAVAKKSPPAAKKASAAATSNKKRTSTTPRRAAMAAAAAITKEARKEAPKEAPPPVDVVVGSRVSILWVGDKKYYDGTVSKISRFGQSSNPHYVEYDDGDSEWTNLNFRKFTFLQKTKKPAKASDTGGSKTKSVPPLVAPPPPEPQARSFDPFLAEEQEYQTQLAKLRAFKRIGNINDTSKMDKELARWVRHLSRQAKQGEVTSSRLAQLSRLGFKPAQEAAAAAAKEASAAAKRRAEEAPPSQQRKNGPASKRAKTAAKNGPASKRAAQQTAAPPTRAAAASAPAPAPFQGYPPFAGIQQTYPGAPPHPQNQSPQVGGMLQPFNLQNVQNMYNNPAAMNHAMMTAAALAGVGANTPNRVGQQTGPGRANTSGDSTILFREMLQLKHSSEDKISQLKKEVDQFKTSADGKLTQLTGNDKKVKDLQTIADGLLNRVVAIERNRDNDLQTLKGLIKHQEQHIITQANTITAQAQIMESLKKEIHGVKEIQSQLRLEITQTNQKQRSFEQRYQEQQNQLRAHQQDEEQEQQQQQQQQLEQQQQQQQLLQQQQQRQQQQQQQQQQRHQPVHVQDPLASLLGLQQLEQQDQRNVYYNWRQGMR